jgi:hypothetical protein
MREQGRKLLRPQILTPATPVDSINESLTMKLART